MVKPQTSYAREISAFPGDCNDLQPGKSVMATRLRDLYQDTTQVLMDTIWQNKQFVKFYQCSHVTVNYSSELCRNPDKREALLPGKQHHRFSVRGPEREKDCLFFLFGLQNCGHQAAANSLKFCLLLVCFLGFRGGGWFFLFCLFLGLVYLFGFF